MDKDTLHGLSLVLIVSASLTLPWLFATVFGRRRNFYSASQRRSLLRVARSRISAAGKRWRPPR